MPSRRARAILTGAQAGRRVLCRTLQGKVAIPEVLFSPNQKETMAYYLPFHFHETGCCLGKLKNEVFSNSRRGMAMSHELRRLYDHVRR